MKRRPRLDPEFAGLPKRLVRFRASEWPDYQPPAGHGYGVGTSSLFWAARLRYELKHGVTLPLDGPGPDAFFDESAI